MCFSATASFTGAALIGSAGVVTLSRISQLREAPLAAVPLLFATQQTIEGFLWLTLPDAGQTARAAALADGFAVIALVVWPVYAPTAVSLVEDVPWRRGLMGLLILLGMLFASYSAFDIAGHPYRAEIVSHSLCYINNSPYPPYAIVIYALAVCGGFLLSSYPVLKWFGLILMGSLAIALAAFLSRLVSVWCFFAAIASLCLLLHFWRRRSEHASV